MQFLVFSVLLTACMVAAGPLKEKDVVPLPTLNADGEPAKREKRSHVGAGSYAQSNSYAAANSYNAGNSYQGGGAPGYIAAPCGAAPIAIAPSGGYPIALPQALPAHGGYGYPSHISPYGGGGGYPQYREDLYENEMSYSDMPAMEHVPMSRSYGYDVVPAASQLSSAYGGGAYGGGAYGGPAVGVFPNANVGGCAVPLLLSCSPNVQAGKIIRQSHYGGAPAGYGSIAVAAGPAGGVAVSAGGAGGYRDVDDHEQEMMQPSHHEEQHLDADMPANREKFPESSEKSHHHHNHEEK